MHPVQSMQQALPRVQAQALRAKVGHHLSLPNVLHVGHLNRKARLSLVCLWAIASQSRMTQRKVSTISTGGFMASMKQRGNVDGSRCPTPTKKQLLMLSIASWQEQSFIDHGWGWGSCLLAFAMWGRSRPSQQHSTHGIEIAEFTAILTGT